MTEAQAEAVVRLQLGQLAALERDEIVKEYRRAARADPRPRAVLSSERNILDVVRATWWSCATSTATSEDRDPHVHGRINYEDLIVEEPCCHNQPQRLYQSGLSLNTYRSQHRAARVSPAGPLVRTISSSISSSARPTLICFVSQQGAALLAQGVRIPQKSRTSLGRHCQCSLAQARGEDQQRHSGAALYGRRPLPADGDSPGIVKKTALEHTAGPRTAALSHQPR